MITVVPASIFDDLHDWFDPVIRRWLPTLSLPGLLPSLIAITFIACIAALVMRRRCGIGGVRLTLWLVALLLPAAAIWTIPAYRAGDSAYWSPCTSGVWLHPAMLTGGVPGEIVVNIALFLPAGAAAWLWSDRTQRLAALLTAMALPTVMELMQLLPALHRQCQVAEAVNNSLGIWLGYCLVAGAVMLAPHAPNPNRPVTRS